MILIMSKIPLLKKDVHPACKPMPGGAPILPDGAKACHHQG
ncbi:hypothetical protein [Sandaracinobacteroides sayramensis]|nr:hypothetical protein [Sandaracinobacteroides sayramensis]